MDIKNIIDKIRNFLDQQIQEGITINIYKNHQKPQEYFKNIGIQVALDSCKEIILQEDTQLELGGINKTSFSLVFPFHILNFIKNGNITLIGPELKDIFKNSIDFGILILIGFEKISEKDFDNLREFNFISNGIEGFMIRTIPRRFWCRISKLVINNFSFEFLGNAIIYLYKQKFKELIKAIEIIMINSHPKLINELANITSEVKDHLKLKWKEKIEQWKKRIDCEYDWECEECPYYDTCEDIKEVLKAREEFQK
ncbi:MAG: hypothetical protein ACTSQJ_12155 [Promethearchaeota archaeon]